MHEYLLKVQDILPQIKYMTNQKMFTVIEYERFIDMVSGSTQQLTF